MSKRSIIIFTLLTLVLLSFQTDNEKKRNVVVVSKSLMTLCVYDDNVYENANAKLLATYPIACGKNLGNKTKKGDMKTPEGRFRIIQIQNASSWTHDFHDGKGEVKNAYGKYFLRLEVKGFSGIGIHGTHDPSSIGKRVTEGCIRLKNEDLNELVKLVALGSVVYITPEQ
ncbi:MAG: L,D-transpeptidase [Bacteroidales bacterium]|jgi:lipoprotein-anchoring transpeptidase ErfK/SrfK|nr:L,D-transpeptidase [Bacteroidales bacterium]